METLDLLQERLEDYDGTLILISHDRDFIDRLATSTIAMNGRGEVVETPGGWTDFITQNPGFFGPAQAAAPKPPKPAAPSSQSAAKQVTKLSFKDQHRLQTLEALTPKLAAEITALEHRLADPDLYTRDRKAFDATTTAIRRLRSELAAAEDEWLALEGKRESLAQSL